MQTAVQFIEKKLDNLLELYTSEWEKVNEVLEQAKQMEAEQCKGGELATFKASSRTELSDEVLKKTLEEINKQPMTFVPNEISDEEIERASVNWNETFDPGIWTFRLAWQAGSKWYREQLKQRQ